MAHDNESTLNTLHVMIEEMSQFQLKTALHLILKGMDFVQAIDHAYSIGIKDQKQKHA
jgi:hypothetical protein